MSKHNKRIVFVVSTGGHVRGLVELADLVAQKGLADAAILNFPSDLRINLPIQPGSSGVQEYVNTGQGIYHRDIAEELIRKTLTAEKPHIFYRFVDSILRRIAITVGGPACAFLLCTVFLYRILKNAMFSSLLFGGGARPHPKESLVKNAFQDALDFVWALSCWLPSNDTLLIGGPFQFLRQTVFFGLWQKKLDMEFAAKFLSEYRADLIVLPEQNHGYSHELLFAVARRTGTPILVLPYSMAGRLEWAEAFSSWQECHVRGVLRRLVAFAYPEWVFVYKGKPLLVPLSWMLSCLSLRCVPSIPWVTNSGPDGLFAVDNEFMREFYQREGVDTSAWRVVGSLAENRLYRIRSEREASRRNISLRAGLNPDLPIILIGLPPDQFDLGIRNGMEFSDYPSLVSFIVGTVIELAGKNYNVAVSLHPRTKRNDVLFVEDSPARIIEGPIEAILPAAILYIAVASATIRWAIASRVPTINFDAYHYNYTDFNGISGVVEVRTILQYKQQVTLITKDQGYRDLLAAAQATDAQRLFNLDGRAEERILGLMAHLCDGHTHAETVAAPIEESGKQDNLLSHAWIYTLANAINGAIPLLLLPILTHYLSPQEYGYVAIFTVLTTVGIAIIGLGTHGAITREYYLRSRDEFAGFVGTCVIILITSVIAILGITHLFRVEITGLTGIPEQWLAAAVLLAACQLLSTIGLTIWQVRGCPIAFGAFQISISLINATLSLWFVIVMAMGWQGRVLGQLAATTLMGIAVILELMRAGWIRFDFSREKAVRALRYGLPLVPHALGATAVATADRAIIANLISHEATGLYYAAAQCAMVITFLADSFNRAYAPWLFSKLAENDPATKRRIVIGTYWYIAIALVATGVMSLIAPWFIEYVLGPKFALASQYIFWLLLANAFVGMYYMVTLYIQFSGKTEWLAAITLSIGALHIALCYTLTQTYGGLGAAQATAVSQLLLFLATWVVAARLVDMNWSLRATA